MWETHTRIFTYSLATLHWSCLIQIVTWWFIFLRSSDGALVVFPQNPVILTLKITIYSVHLTEIWSSSARTLCSSSWRSSPLSGYFDPTWFSVTNLNFIPSPALVRDLRLIPRWFNRVIRHKESSLTTNCLETFYRHLSSEPLAPGGTDFSTGCRTHSIRNPVLHGFAESIISILLVINVTFVLLNLGS